MPKLLVFAPCHKVLFDQDNNVSVISILQELRVPASERMPNKVQAMIRWDVLGLWGRVPGDEGRAFEQDVMLMSPDGTMAAHTKQQFSMSALTHRNVSTMWGFPVSQAGEYSLVLKLKDLQDESVCLVETTYPLYVIHETKADSPT